MAKRNPLTQEQLELCPYGDSKCPICRLDPEAIKYIHECRFEKDMQYTDIRERIKFLYKVSPNLNSFTDHFNQHVITQTLNKLIDSKNKTLVKAINENISIDTRSNSDKNIEAAFKKLTHICENFTKNVEKIGNVFTLDEKQLNEDLKDLSPLDKLTFLERFGKLHKESREMVKDLVNLRAPKVIVTEYFKSFTNEMISEVGRILENACFNIQDEILMALEKMNLGIELDKRIFTSIFKEVGEQYKEAALSLQRDQILKTTKALDEMDKIM